MMATVADNYITDSGVSRRLEPLARQRQARTNAAAVALHSSPSDRVDPPRTDSGPLATSQHPVEFHAERSTARSRRSQPLARREIPSRSPRPPARQGTLIRRS